MDTTRFDNLCKAALVAIASLQIVSCALNGEKNLWSRDFTKPQDTRSAAESSKNDVKGYWEGSVAMGGVRARIEEGRITLALKCDSEGKILSQGSAPISFKPGAPPAMVLQEDLMSGKDEACGFRFAKGGEFRYNLRDDGILEMDFAGTSVAGLRKLSN